MNGYEGAGVVHQFHQFDNVGLDPLISVGAGEGGGIAEGAAMGVEVESVGGGGVSKEGVRSVTYTRERTYIGKGGERGHEGDGWEWGMCEVTEWTGRHASGGSEEGASGGPRILQATDRCACRDKVHVPPTTR